MGNTAGIVSRGDEPETGMKVSVRSMENTDVGTSGGEEFGTFVLSIDTPAIRVAPEGAQVLVSSNRSREFLASRERVEPAGDRLREGDIRQGGYKEPKK